ncbi:uncharacterized protein V1518DRAFT_405905 [Limtongia smithiae]|uniref:uncharacterized protein n=1 Tax=Limtongia smithiae TaxID=1125753 RepID=UPI0034CEA59E
MVDDTEDAARQEKLAAARKRIEELKKQQEKKPVKKKTATKKKGTAAATAAAAGMAADETEDGGDEAPDATADDGPAGAAVVDADSETPPPPDSSIAVTELIDDGGMDSSTIKPVAGESVRAEFSSDIESLKARLATLEIENAALKDSLSTANAKIQVDSATIASLQAKASQASAIGSPVVAKSPEYYHTLEEKFSREAQERYLLERDYAALSRSHDKLMSQHNAVIDELDRLKFRFSADEKRRQTETDGSPVAVSPLDEKTALAARERAAAAANINARLHAGTSSLFRTAQGLSAAVVKGVTGSANAVISETPTLARIMSTSSGTRPTQGLLRAGSSTSTASGYADVDLYAGDTVAQDGDDEDGEAVYQRGLERATRAAVERERLETETRAKLEWVSKEMNKWKGFQLDLVAAGGSPAGSGEMFVV